MRECLNLLSRWRRSGSRCRTRLRNAASRLIESGNFLVPTGRSEHHSWYPSAWRSLGHNKVTHLFGRGTLIASRVIARVRIKTKVHRGQAAGHDDQRETAHKRERGDVAGLHSHSLVASIGE
jgi:hypothetical protein